MNKTESKVELRVSMHVIVGLTEPFAERLKKIAGKQVTEAGEILLVSQRHRSQVRNREEVLARLVELLRACQRTPRTRRPTRPTKSAQEKRLKGKRKRSEHKASRRKVHAD